MQEERVRNKPARHRPKFPHHAPRGVRQAYAKTYTALPKPYVGLSDGRIYDPRSGYALDWWGVGTLRPDIYQDPGTETTDIWQVVFVDGAAVATLTGIYVVSEPQQGQLRVQEPASIYSLEHAWPAWANLPEPPYIRSHARALRRERQAGRRPVDETPLLMSSQREPQTWPPPGPDSFRRTYR